MIIDNLFSGNALRAVDGEGRTTLPPFVLSVLERRGAGARIVFGPHPADPCISGYDRGFEPLLFAELERLRLRDEAGGESETGHRSRARIMFGAAEQASVDSRGRVVLPPMMRRRCRIEELALFVGTGGAFEVWNPELARRQGGEALRELAELAIFQAEEREMTQ